MTMAHSSKRKGTQRSTHHHKPAPWWLYLILVPLLSFVFSFVGVINRSAVGLSVIMPAKNGIEFLAWIGYAVAWIVFAILIHQDEQGFNTYVPWCF
jgi:hypothetical protein